METTQELVTIETNGKEFVLTPAIVKQYICPKATPQEIYYFLQLCKAQNLNPFIREVYLIKYKDGEPATMVTGKETFLKRAMRNPKYRGHKAWTEGSLKDGNLQAFADVFVEGYTIPITVEVDYEEYVGYTWKDGKRVPNRMWSEKPKTMLRKVALMQALREAFPDELGGLYDQTEINTIPTELPEQVIEVKAEPVTPKAAEKKETKKTEPKKTAPAKTEVVEAEVVVDDMPEVEPRPDDEPIPVDPDADSVPTGDIPMASQQQIKMIHTLYGKKGLTDDDAKAMMTELFGVLSSKELTKKQATTFIEALLALKGKA